jgi:hypothetical protein
MTADAESSESQTSALFFPERTVKGAFPAAGA